LQVALLRPLERPLAYRRRIIDEELDELLTELPAVSIEGAKAVGKTATASERADAIYLLEDPATRQLLEADPQRVSEIVPALIDEWQRFAPIWDVVRRAVDAGAHPGSYLLTGSASQQNPGTHSGAGRITRMQMRPLSLAERGVVEPTVSLAQLLTGERPEIRGSTAADLRTYVEEIETSGFPGIRRLRGRARRAQLRGYIDRVIDRDLPEFGHPLRNPAQLRRWLAAYAAAVSTTTSFEKIRQAATSGEGTTPARTTTIPYRDALERLYLLDPVPAWQPGRNHIRELAAAPKHQLVDPALAVSLLGLNQEALLTGDEPNVPLPRDGTYLGALFESLATLSLHVYAQAAEAKLGHLRTHRGEHEIDLIVERGDQRVVAVEVKLARSATSDDVTHLHWLANKIGDDLLDMVLITTGQDAYRRADGVAVVPAALLGP
jgi:predicted AAA+ superfamily ATPase